MAVYNKIYRADFLRENKIKFINGLFLEDQFFYIESFLKAKAFIINNEPLYIYNQTNNSSTTNTISKSVFKIFRTINKVEQVLKENKCIEEYKYAFFQHKYTSILFYILKLHYFQNQSSMTK